MACCKDCTKRYPMCHSECNDYIEEVTKRKQERELINKKRSEDRYFTSNYEKSKRRVRRRNNNDGYSTE